MTCKEHPKYELPNTPHAKHRYESAMKHVEAQCFAFTDDK